MITFKALKHVKLVTDIFFCISLSWFNDHRDKLGHEFRLKHKSITKKIALLCINTAEFMHACKKNKTRYKVTHFIFLLLLRL